MCGSQLASLLFATIGFACVAYRLHGINSLQPAAQQKNFYTNLGNVVPLFVYSMMELTQGIQYSYVDHCDSKVNFYLTALAYILLWVQPSMWIWVMRLRTLKNKKVMTAFWYMSLFTMVMGLAKLFTPIGYSSLLKSSDGGLLTNGSKTCAYLGENHLAWQFAMNHWKGMEPNYFAYLLPWFFATFWVEPRFEGYRLLLSFAGGLIASYLYYGYTDELPSAWCFWSIPMLLTGSLFQAKF